MLLKTVLLTLGMTTTTSTERGGPRQQSALYEPTTDTELGFWKRELHFVSLGKRGGSGDFIPSGRTLAFS